MQASRIPRQRPKKSPAAVGGQRMTGSRAWRRTAHAGHNRKFLTTSPPSQRELLSTVIRGTADANEKPASTRKIDTSRGWTRMGKKRKTPRRRRASAAAFLGENSPLNPTSGTRQEPAARTKKGHASYEQTWPISEKTYVQPYVTLLMSATKKPSRMMQPRRLRDNGLHLHSPHRQPTPRRLNENSDYPD